MATIAELLAAVFTIGITVALTVIATRRITSVTRSPAVDVLTQNIPDESTADTQPSIPSDSDNAFWIDNKPGLTLRVDNIPHKGTDIETLTRNLSTILTRDPILQNGVAKFCVRSLVSRGRSSLCATVAFSSFLRVEDLCLRLQRNRHDLPLTFSNNFDGITPLYEDETGSDVDIIAVPGLGSHALGSWRSPTSDDVWLRDFLPKDLPKIRVLLYGYDTTLPGSRSKQSIETLGAALMEKVVAFRARDGTSCRSIVFIGHSLGGLLVKEALVRARLKRSEANSQLCKACYGLVFFGVPNLGLRNEQLKTLVHGQPNDSLIHDLLVDRDSEPSAFLKRLADQFSKTCCGRYKVVSFFERLESPTVEHRDGMWRRTGPTVLMVTEKSATSTGLVAVADEDNIGLDSDHSGLVKFDTEHNSDYGVVCERVRRLVEEGRSEITRRFAEHDLKGVHINTDACLKSLAFSDMGSRLDDITDATDGTCQWFLQHKTLVEWTRQSRGLLWIKGKPGSGKSTLMRYATRHVPALYSSDTLALSFFFHGRGHKLQRTLPGLFRSLLHQLLKKVPGAVLDLVNYFDEKEKSEGKCGEKWQWHVRQLQDFLLASLPTVLTLYPVILVIDALDECGKDAAVVLIDFLQTLLAKLPATDARMGILFSCRHYPILHLDRGLTITLDKENNIDIDSYVRRSLTDDHCDDHIRQLISNRAEGVFMWAHLVVKRVLHMCLDNESQGAIEAEIKRIPPTLEELYRNEMDKLERPAQTLTLMQWICFSMRPLTLPEIQWALAVAPDGAFNTLDDCKASDNFIADSKLKSRINTLSCGLAEIVHSPGSSMVQFIHQSVKDFFMTSGLSFFERLEPSITTYSAIHCQLGRICLQYFKLAVHAHPEPFRKEECPGFPLLHYAVTEWTSHTALGDSAEEYPQDLINTLGPRTSLLESWIETFVNIDHDWNRKRPERGHKLIHIVAWYGLSTVLKRMISDSVEINERDSQGRTALSYAAQGGYESIMRFLLETGQVDIDSKDSYSRTPLSLAAEEGCESIVRLLLETGQADIDAKDSKGRTPLSYTARGGHESIVRFLLETGQVDIDTKDSYGRTPLSYAAEEGFESIVRLLLDTDRADIQQMDNGGQTALSWASENGNDEIAQMLRYADRLQ